MCSATENTHVDEKGEGNQSVLGYITSRGARERGKESVFQGWSCAEVLDERSRERFSEVGTQKSTGSVCTWTHERIIFGITFILQFLCESLKWQDLLRRNRALFDGCSSVAWIRTEQLPIFILQFCLISFEYPIIGCRQASCRSNLDLIKIRYEIKKIDKQDRIGYRYSSICVWYERCVRRWTGIWIWKRVL